MLSTLAESGNIESALRIYAQVAALTSTEAASSALTVGQAKGAAALIVPSGLSEHVPEARQLLTDITEFAEANPENPALRLEQARCAANLTAVEAGLGSLADAESSCDAVGKLAERHPHDPELQEQYARAMLLLLELSVDLADSSRAQSLHRAIAEIAARFPDRDFLRELKSRADAHLTRSRGGNRNLSRAPSNLRRASGTSFVPVHNPSNAKLGRPPAEHEDDDEFDRSAYAGVFLAGVAFILFFLPICYMSASEQRKDFFEVLLFTKSTEEIPLANAIFDIRFLKFSLPRDLPFLSALGIAYGTICLMSVLVKRSSKRLKEMVELAIAANGMFFGYINTVVITHLFEPTFSSHLTFLRPRH